LRERELRERIEREREMLTLVSALGALRELCGAPMREGESDDKETKIGLLCLAVQDAFSCKSQTAALLALEVRVCVCVYVCVCVCVGLV
jgi:hypothetical protein